MNDRFHGRTVLVTGASSGIGQAAAKRLDQEGSRLVLVARNEERLAQTLAGLSDRAHLSFACDVTDEDAIGDLFKQLATAKLSLGGLVHSAGIHSLRPIKMLKRERVVEMLESHVVSSIALTRAWLKSKCLPAEGGAAVWLASAAALRGEAATAAYAASKAGMIAAARALAVELASIPLRINTIAPGVVRTPQSQAFLSKLSEESVAAVEQDHLLGFGEPNDIAGPIAFLLSDDARWITGQTLVVDGGLTIH